MTLSSTTLDITNNTNITGVLTATNNIKLGTTAQDSELTFYSPHMAEIKFTTAGQPPDAPLASIGCLYNPTAMAFNIGAVMVAGLTDDGMMLQKNCQSEICLGIRRLLCLT